MIWAVVYPHAPMDPLAYFGDKASAEDNAGQYRRQGHPCLVVLWDELANRKYGGGNVQTKRAKHREVGKARKKQIREARRQARLTKSRVAGPR